MLDIAQSGNTKTLHILFHENAFRKQISHTMQRE